MKLYNIYKIQLSLIAIHQILISKIYGYDKTYEISNIWMIRLSLLLNIGQKMWIYTNGREGWEMVCLSFTLGVKFFKCSALRMHEVIETTMFAHFTLLMNQCLYHFHNLSSLWGWTLRVDHKLELIHKILM